MPSLPRLPGTAYSPGSACAYTHTGSGRRVGLAGDGPVAAVAADVGAAVGKGVDGQLAVVAAATADLTAGLVAERLQRFPGDQCAGLAVLGLTLPNRAAP